jgi:hypothetical protein
MPLRAFIVFGGNYYHYLRHGRTSGREVLMPLRAFIVFGAVHPNQRQRLLFRLNALAGIYCFWSVQLSCSLWRYVVSLNALAGIYCFWSREHDTLRQITVQS